jgi:hypothetical protein
LSADPRYAEKFRNLADELWGGGERNGAVAQLPARRVLQTLGVNEDFTATQTSDEGITTDYIHRRTSGAEIYFVASRLGRRQDVECSFRIAGRQPELWDPVSGERRDAVAFTQRGGRTIVPLRFPPYGSMFVVFRRPIDRAANGTAASNDPSLVAVHEFAGPWGVEFDARWGGPAEPVVFSELLSWTERPETGIRYYSGPAVYRKTFDLPAGGQGTGGNARWWLDLGEVKNLAAIRLNGQDVAVAWTEPFRVELTGRVQPEGNELEIEVTNLWPNRLIGDQRESAEKRLTNTNVRKFREDSPLIESGLQGPVRLLTESAAENRP